MNAKLLFTALILGTAPVQLAQAAEPVSEQLRDPGSADVEVVGHILEPEPQSPTPERLESLDRPDGFDIAVFASGLTNPRMIAVSDDGTVYVTERASGRLVLLRDEDGDGSADVQETVASRPGMHGVAVEGRTLYLVTVNDIYRAELSADGRPGELERIVDDLPDAGQHPNRMVVLGPDGKLYVSVGSTCNACSESNPENATILKVEPDGSSRSIFATGLRNTIGYGFEPETGTLYGMDHGIDWLGDNEQGEELNRIVEGRSYGWPYVYDEDLPNPQDEPPNDLPFEAWAAQSEEPELLYTPHAAPMQLAFYMGDQFPAEYRGDAFVAMRGSWNRKPPAGYEVLRVDFQNGQPVGFEAFVTGFLVETEGGWGQLGRLAGLAVAADGALLLSDDENGVIYRIAYAGTGDEQAALAPSAGGQAPAADAASDPGPPELSGAALHQQVGPVDVISPAFDDGATIPPRHAAEGENVSPPLQWGEGPDGTGSYVVMMEDPDVAQEPPFVHWMLYNLPPDVTTLREGLPADPRLADPAGALQGRNDAGRIGYFGPRPPVGDPPHPYHFQVFALDTMLDLPHGVGRSELLEAMEGHVLSIGEIVGTYRR